ncbi:disintegrin and metalloproteinase domain-containing protein 9-like isoform X2 [Bufo gargarizans]|uniref:disintegrin and metalloproteinase domain-containing protein 9-like isoform X2 n=1 Tax=Bufo gargarizans TaxID=30331 RepID=UPI001CF1044D|nr:disintegrin and metalloproteinase domain-containing protein 9-like isoform X2 [Bufo gargarizans]
MIVYTKLWTGLVLRNPKKHKAQFLNMGERWLLSSFLYILLSGYHISGLQDDEIVFPERLVNRVRRNVDDSTDENVSYIIQTSNRTLILNLQRNRDFVSKDFEHFTYSKDGGLKALNSTAPKYSCYYHGQVEGMEDSVVALSDCHGLRGVMYLSEVHYGIEPMEHPFGGAHRLYQLDEPDGASMCGVVETVDTSHTLLPSYYLLRRKRAVLAITSYVELGVVVDNLRYLGDKSNTDAVEVETIELVNIVHGMFRPLNIQIVLTNLITWTTNNPIDVTSGSAGDVLGRFTQWRGENKIQRCDIYHLLMGRGPFGGVIGMAFVGTVCSPSYATSISAFNVGVSPPSHATVVAHELGHVLGMSHDDNRCASNYVMFSSDNNARTFSSCSANDFERLILRGSGKCLQNPPYPNQVLSIPACGNNVVERGEECDCGSTKECQNPCCNAATCRLTSGSQCAQGLCCENCKFKVGGTICREKSNTCDLPEYCNGAFALCPVDFYIMDGYPCNNTTSYCYSGVCQSYNDQCKALLGAGTSKGPDVCFQTLNIKGDQYGNCGLISGNPQPCTTADSLCGKLQCTGTYIKIPNSTIVSHYYNGVDCISIDFDLGSDVPDPGLVHQGSPCAEGKACVNYKCQNASALGFNCDIKGKCHDHGVCNNNGNCHCDYGWAPPNCDTSGYGGSIDSGPTHIDTSLRDGLLIFFLLVLPILILLVVMFIKRDTIRRRFCRKRRRRGGNEQRQEQNNYANRNQNAYANSNTAGNLPRNQDRTFSDVFTISHNVPRRPPVPPARPVPPTRPPRPQLSTTPQYTWPDDV